MTTIKKTETHDRLSVKVDFHLGGSFTLRFNRNSFSIGMVPTPSIYDHGRDHKADMQTIAKYVNNLKGNYGQQLQHMITMCEPLASTSELLNWIESKTK